MVRLIEWPVSLIERTVSLIERSVSLVELVIGISTITDLDGFNETPPYYSLRIPRLSVFPCGTPVSRAF